MAEVSAALRREVRARAGVRCEYCLMPEGLVLLGHQIDHIISLQHRGPTHSDNLALCCADCNGFKGPNLSSLDPGTDLLVRLFHPRRDEWSAHFSLESDGWIRTKTAVGRVTEHVLRLNDPDRVEQRRGFLAAGLMGI